jgi:hypothetical protein
MEPTDTPATDREVVKALMSSLPTPEPSEGFERRMVERSLHFLHDSKALSATKARELGCDHSESALKTRSLRGLNLVNRLLKRPTLLALEVTVVALMMLYFYTQPTLEDVMATDLISELSLATI